MGMAGTLEGDARSVDRVATRRAATKRVLDLLIGIPLCVVALPIVAGLAVVLVVGHRVVPFFAHERIGRSGTTIVIPKLRTLSPRTPRYADKMTMSLQPVSGFAEALRRTHLDELPQLFLVPLGRLSLVGPRPRMLTEAERCGDAEYEAVRTSVHQGCTGLWQISDGQGTRVSDRPEYDLFYVSQHTLRLDLWILWRTLLQAVVGGTISLEDVPRWTLRHPARVLAEVA